jgi:hypothetical protein
VGRIESGVGVWRMGVGDGEERWNGKVDSSKMTLQEM